MQLSKKTIKNINPQPGLTLPDQELFDLPEKVLQFGTGVLLRGLPDYFIDKANRQGLFNGRVVMVKSTATGGTDDFEKQDGLFTICVQGLREGQTINERIINSSISRVISAKDNWNSILTCAQNPGIQLIISNTTEVGIALIQDDIRLSPPLSFPGKLLAFLYERYKAFGGTGESGMVIVPTELIPDNGTTLRCIVLELARMNRLDENFISWLKNANHFCNSLVDRIVPGKLSDQEIHEIETSYGYKDELAIMTESFRLWAIESDSDKVKTVLSFALADEGVIIAPDIEKFRELKLRLLNGTHSFGCGLALLAGFDTVREAMDDDLFSAFIQALAIEEIAAAISNGTLDYNEAVIFANQVFDRFRNPYIRHNWSRIAVQYCYKMKTRNVPLLLKHYTKTNQPPVYMALGFAAFLLFMKPGSAGDNEGSLAGKAEKMQDDNAFLIVDKWKEMEPDRLVDAVLADAAFWGTDLSLLPGFGETVKVNLNSLMNNGAMESLRLVQLNKTEA